MGISSISDGGLDDGMLVVLCGDGWYLETKGVASAFAPSLVILLFTPVCSFWTMHLPGKDRTNGSGELFKYFRMRYVAISMPLLGRLVKMQCIGTLPSWFVWPQGVQATPLSVPLSIMHDDFRDRLGS